MSNKKNMSKWKNVKNFDNYTIDDFDEEFVSNVHYGDSYDEEDENDDLDYNYWNNSNLDDEEDDFDNDNEDEEKVNYNIFVSPSNLFLDEKRKQYYMKNENDKYCFVEDLVNKMKEYHKQDIYDLWEFYDWKNTKYYEWKFKQLEWEELENKIIDYFVKRYKEIKNVRKNENLSESVKDNEAVLSFTKCNCLNEIDLTLYSFINWFYSVWESPISFPWIFQIPSWSRIERVFPAWVLTDSILERVKEKIKLDRLLNNNNFKENKFIKNIFNQMQMLTNIKKTDIYDFDWNLMRKDEYERFVKSLPEDVDLFMYNLSYKEGNNYLRSYYYKDLLKIKDKLNNLVDISKKNKHFNGKDFKDKIMFVDFNKEENLLYIIMPFSVNSNVGTFFECFKTSIKTEDLLKQYYKINWFKLIFSNKGKEIISWNNANQLKEIFDRWGDYETYLLKLNH